MPAELRYNKTMSRTKSQFNRPISYKLLLPLIFIFLLGGCISQNRYVWQHPAGYGEAERQQAIALCEQIAANELRRYDYYDPFPYYHDRYYFDRYDYRDRYHFLPHYYHYKSHREFHDRRRFFRICMKSKGWQLSKIPRQQTQP